MIVFARHYSGSGHLQLLNGQLMFNPACSICQAQLSRKVWFHHQPLGHTRLYRRFHTLVWRLATLNGANYAPYGFGWNLGVGQGIFKALWRSKGHL